MNWSKVMLSDRFLHSLLPQIYEAAVEPELWPSALEELVGAFDGNAGSLGVHDFQRQSGTLYQTFGYQPALLDDYTDHHASRNVWLRHERFYRRAGALVVGPQVLPDEELVRTEFYREWLRPQDLHHRLCGVLRRRGSSAAYFTVMRPERAPAFDGDDRSRAGLVVPHLQRALQLHRRIAILRQEREAAQEALDRLPTGVLFVDRQARLIASNSRAEEILKGGDLTVRSNVVRTPYQETTNRLHDLIAACHATASGAGTDAGGVVQIPRGEGRQPLQILVTPMRSMCDLLGHERSIAAVFVSDPDLPIEAEADRLCQLYGLTRVEAELTIRIVGGRSVEEASKSLRLSVNTGRAYLKRIFSKTGVRRQADLVRLVLIGPAQLRSP